MNRYDFDSGVSVAAAPDRRRHARFDRLRMALVTGLATLFLGACETINGLAGGDGDRPAEIREVVVAQTPFYNSFPSAKSVPFIYLTQGTAVEWRKRRKDFAKVKLANGQSGWMPEVSLGPSVGGRPADPATSESKPSRDAMRDVRSRAIHTERKDDSLNRFNIAD